MRRTGTWLFWVLLLCALFSASARAEGETRDIAYRIGVKTGNVKYAGTDSIWSFRLTDKDGRVTQWSDENGAFFDPKNSLGMWYGFPDRGTGEIAHYKMNWLTDMFQNCFEQNDLDLFIGNLRCPKDFDQYNVQKIEINFRNSGAAAGWQLEAFGISFGGFHNFSWKPLQTNRWPVYPTFAAGETITTYQMNIAPGKWLDHAQIYTFTTTELMKQHEVPPLKDVRYAGQYMLDPSAVIYPRRRDYENAMQSAKVVKVTREKGQPYQVTVRYQLNIGGMWDNVAHVGLDYMLAGVKVPVPDGVARIVGEATFPIETTRLPNLDSAFFSITGPYETNRVEIPLRSIIEEATKDETSYGARITRDGAVVAQYDRLDIAIDAAKSGDTVELLEDADLSGHYTQLKAGITLRLNGHQIEGDGAIYASGDIILGKGDRLQIGKGGDGAYLNQLQLFGNLISEGEISLYTPISRTGTIDVLGGSLTLHGESRFINGTIKIDKGQKLTFAEDFSATQKISAFKLFDVANWESHFVFEGETKKYAEYIAIEALNNPPAAQGLEAALIEKNGRIRRFQSLDQALDAAKSGDMVRIESNITLARTLEVPKGVTLRLNRNKISGAGLRVKGRLVIQNGETLRIAPDALQSLTLDGSINTKGILEIADVEVMGNGTIFVDGGAASLAGKATLPGIDFRLAKGRALNIMEGFAADSKVATLSAKDLSIGRRLLLPGNGETLDSARFFMLDLPIEKGYYVDAQGYLACERILAPDEMLPEYLLIERGKTLDLRSILPYAYGKKVSFAVEGGAASIEGGLMSVLKARRYGEGVLSATFESGIVASIPIYVVSKGEAPKSVTGARDLTLNVGEAQRLALQSRPKTALDQSLFYQSSNPAVAMVQDGLLRGVGKGICRVTAQNAGGAKVVFRVTVK